MKRVFLIVLALCAFPLVASAGTWCNDYYAVLEASYWCTSPCGSGPCDYNTDPVYGGHPALGYETGPTEGEACANANNAMCNDISTNCGICGPYVLCTGITNSLSVLVYEEPGMCVYSSYGWCWSVDWNC